MAERLNNIIFKARSLGTTAQVLSTLFPKRLREKPQPGIFFLTRDANCYTCKDELLSGEKVIMDPRNHVYCLQCGQDIEETAQKKTPVPKQKPIFSRLPKEWTKG